MGPATTRSRTHALFSNFAPSRVLTSRRFPRRRCVKSNKSAIDRVDRIDKDSAGSKADAVNAGLNAATSPYVCVVDADSILERDSLLRIMTGIFFRSSAG